jgi:hypothetical protein
MGQETENFQSVDWNALLWEPIKQNGAKLASFLPSFINAIFILALGWIVAFAVQLIFRRFLKFIGFDKIAEKTGIAVVLSDNGISTLPTELFSRLMFWVVMIAVIVKSLYEVRLFDIAAGLDIFAGLIFQSIGLLVIFIIGLSLSVILSKIIHITSTNLKVKSPQAYSRVMKWAILVFMFLLILRQITIPMNFVFIVLGAVFASLCVTFVIAFGVGGIGWAAKILEKISK